MNKSFVESQMHYIQHAQVLQNQATSQPHRQAMTFSVNPLHAIFLSRQTQTYVHLGGANLVHAHGGPIRQHWNLKERFGTDRVFDIARLGF